MQGCDVALFKEPNHRYHIPTSNSIFNSAVVPFEDGFAGVFRCDNKAVQMNIFAGFSKDGVNWEINHEPIKFEAGNTESQSTSMTHVLHGLRIVIGLLGVMVITDQQSVLLTPSTSRSSISVRMLSCHSIVMAYSRVHGSVRRLVQVRFLS